MHINSPQFETHMQADLYGVAHQEVQRLLETARTQTLTPDRVRETELDYVGLIPQLQADFNVVVSGLVARARNAGFTWAEVARAAGMRSAQAAFARWGHDVDAREHAASEAPSVPRQAPGVDLPGMSAAEYARYTGLDPRTVKARGARGEIRTTTVTQASGRTQTRYLAGDDAAGTC